MIRTVAGGDGDPDHEWLSQFHSGKFAGQPNGLFKYDYEEVVVRVWVRVP